MTPPCNLNGRTTRGEAGFSLIELLVALSLFALVMALLPGAFHTGRRGWETAGALDRRASDDAAVDFVRQRLAEAAPLYESDASGRKRQVFLGLPDAVMFVAPAASGPDGGGLYRYTLTLRLAEAQTETALILTITPFGRTAAAAVRERRLLSAPGVLSLRYFGTIEDGQPPGWTGMWPRDDRLPQLVELNAATFGPVRVALKLQSECSVQSGSDCRK